MNPITITYTFDTNLQQVWDALSMEAALKKWYFPVENYQFQEGTTFTFYESAESKNYLHQCTFIKITPLQLIEYTWEHPSHSKGSSVVKWEIEKVSEDKTKVTLSHTGTENFADAGADFSRENYIQGWDAIVGTLLRNYLNGIERLMFNIDIKASTEKVWKTLWDSDTYTQWTAPFCEGSYFSGSIIQGGRIHFLAPNGSGMYSDIVFLKENNKIIFKHIGVMKDNIEMPIDDETRQWSGCYEIYTLTESNGGTHLQAEADIVDSHAEYMKKSFPAALEKVKQICEAL